VLRRWPVGDQAAQHDGLVGRNDFRLEPFASGLYTAGLVITPQASRWRLPEGAGLLLLYERYHADNSFDSGIVSAGLRIPLKR